MTDFESSDASQDHLLPIVGEGVIDALHRDLIEMFNGDKAAEDFIAENCAVIQDENLGVAIILRHIVDAVADDEGLTSGAKMLLGGIIVYRLLRNQAEADRMNQLPFSGGEK